jgi:hypothetical protein
MKLINDLSQPPAWLVRRAQEANCADDADEREHKGPCKTEGKVGRQKGCCWLSSENIYGSSGD